MRTFPIYDITDQLPWLIPVILLAFFGAIVLAVIMVKRHTNLFKDNEKPKSEAEVAEEELNRVLQPVEDEQVAESMKQFDQAQAIEEGKAEEEVLGEDKPIE